MKNMNINNVKGWKQAARRAEGITLIELMIAMVICGLMTAAMYKVYGSVSRTATTQGVIVGVQQDLRGGLDFIANDIRMAGFDPQSRGIFGIELAANNKIRFTSDMNMNGAVDMIGFGAVDAAGNDIAAEWITYELVGTELRLRLNEATGSDVSETLLDNVAGLQFDYYRADGTLLAPVVVGDIRAVEITLRVRDSSSYGEVDRTLSTRIKCRNLGFGL